MKKPLSTEELEDTILQMLLGHQYHLTGDGPDTLFGALKERLPDGSVNPSDMIYAVWSLVTRGLIIIDFFNIHSAKWTLDLTPKGRAAALDEEANPDNPSKYVQRLKTSVQNVNPTVLQYAEEALDCYNNRNYLASAVMLGVASEAAFLDMARAFGNWLPEGKERTNFVRSIENNKQIYLAKFSEFRKRIETHKSELPDDLSDGMALTFDSILDLLRIYRNDAGHPTGKQMSRDDSFINLEMFVRYLQKLYAFKSFFDEVPPRKVKS